MRTFQYALLALVAAFPALADDFDDHGFGFRRSEIARAAHDLSDAAEHFHRVIHSLTGYSHLAMDAHRLSETAEHFHRTVESGASFAHLMRDYSSLQSSYRHLRAAFRRAHGIHHNHHVEYDWEHVVMAADELNYAMFGFDHGGHGGGHGPDHGDIRPFPRP